MLLKAAFGTITRVFGSCSERGPEDWASLPLEASVTPSLTLCDCHDNEDACHIERGPGQSRTNT
jgi:hypothetical protein